jgi:phospholipase/carboxylesterase
VNPHLSSAFLSWGCADAPLAILGLHGRGQSPETIGELRARVGDESAYWLAPAAAGLEWYPYRFMEAQPEGAPWLEWSCGAIEAGLARLRHAGWPPERTILLGFSQGACLAAHYALTRPARYAGIVVLTGGYMGPNGADIRFDGDFAGSPALITTAEHDEWVPLTRVRETEAWLRALGCRVTSLIEPGGEHAVSDASVALLRRMLAKVILPA